MPAHNEAGRISPTLSSYLSHFRQRARLIVVLNGCTDDTREVVAAVIDGEKADTAATVIDIAAPIGKAGAVYEGFRRAQTKYVGFVDADGSTPAFEFERLRGELNGADAVIGSRRLPYSHVANRTWLRRFISWGFAVLAQHYVKLGFRDTQCGAKIFRTDAVKPILPTLVVRNGAFDLELLLALKRAGRVVKEEPTLWIDNSTSTMFTSPLKLAASARDMFSTLRALSRLRS